jgi:type IV secretory pathway TraG/TraD family ATPase VirD4
MPLHLSELALVYGATLVPLVAILIRNRAPWPVTAMAPLHALVATLIGILLWLAYRSWLMPQMQWHPGPRALALTGLLFFIATGAMAGLAIAGPRPRVQHQRGTVIERSRPRRIPNGAISIARIPLDSLDETKHIKLIGTTGTGKSTAIREILEGALARGDRVVIADPDGGYLGRYYDPKAGDAIVNPFDPRSRRWDLFAEIEQPYDVEQLARALIPDHDGEEQSWRGYARTFFTAVTRQLWSLKQRGGGGENAYASVPELYRLLTMADSEELKLLLEGTTAQPFLESGNERMFGSIRSVTANAIAALEYVARQEADPISLRDWIRHPAGKRALFLPYSATQIAALRAIISAWLRLVIFETMSGGERDQRIWFIVDELDALGAIDGLKDALARLRKFGGRCVLGFQSIAQVSTTYGQGEAQTIVENCGTTLILRCSASEQGGTARFASRLIGEREVIRPHESSSIRAGEWQASRTSSTQQVTEAAILPSEVEQLPDLSGFLKLASSPNWTRVKLRR